MRRTLLRLVVLGAVGAWILGGGIRLRDHDEHEHDTFWEPSRLRAG